MAAVIEKIGEFPFFVQVALGIWIVAIILCALVLLTCLGFVMSGRGENLRELTAPIFVGFIWSIVGIGLTYALGAYLYLQQVHYGGEYPQTSVSDASKISASRFA